ncbi:tyrosine-type recombinase/integrase [Barrientosiimonas humi]|uniref:tyrosine-type recombinase/integrase n=1 Tax=Barrientosiimonas humi TaxID=999931 RepID=UPI00370D62D2
MELTAEQMRVHSDRLADLLLVLGWTGVRWGEARSLRVADVQRVGGHALIVRSSHSEGLSEKTTKGGRSRRVPVADRVWSIVLGWCEGRAPDDHLFVTERGAQLHKSNFRRAVHWAEHARGHSIHDLRHAAATEWLRSGVDVRTVQAWLGHASLTTTQVYVHYLGTHADRAAIDLVNVRGMPGARDSDNDNDRASGDAS